MLGGQSVAGTRGFPLLAILSGGSEFAQSCHRVLLGELQCPRDTVLRGGHGLREAVTSGGHTAHTLAAGLPAQCHAGHARCNLPPAHLRVDPQTRGLQGWGPCPPLGPRLQPAGAEPKPYVDGLPPRRDGGRRPAVKTSERPALSRGADKCCPLSVSKEDGPLLLVRRLRKPTLREGCHLRKVTQLLSP